jgi:hypothetical protein
MHAKPFWPAKMAIVGKKKTASEPTQGRMLIKIAYSGRSKRHTQPQGYENKTSVDIAVAGHPFTHSETELRFRASS